MLQAKVQGRFKFLGAMRHPGDIITPEELAKSTTQVRDALKDQGLIILESDDPSQSPSLLNPEMVQHLQAQVEILTGQLSALTNLVAEIRPVLTEQIGKLDDLSGRFTGLAETVIKAQPGRGRKPTTEE